MKFIKKLANPSQPFWKWQHVIAFLSLIVAIFSATVIWYKNLDEDTKQQVEENLVIEGNKNCGNIITNGNANNVSVESHLICQ